MMTEKDFFHVLSICTIIYNNFLMTNGDGHSTVGHCISLLI